MKSRHALSSFLLALITLSMLLFASCAEPIAPTLDLTPTSQTLIAGQPLQLTVTRRFKGGAVEDVTSRVTYTTTDRSIASVSDHGVVTAGTRPGSVVIKVFDSISEATAIAGFTVIEPAITSIDVSPPVVPRVIATAHFNNGTTSDVSSQVLWSSTNAAAAIVGNSQLDRGIVSAVADGDTAIIATDAKTGVTGRATVFVTGSVAFLQAILVTPNPGIVAVGKTVELSALGIYSDGSNKYLTKSVTWTSSRTDVATVDANGVVTGVVAGDTTITATGPEPSTTVKGSAAVKVVP